MPGTKSNRIVRWTWAVPPVGLTATTLSDARPARDRDVDAERAIGPGGSRDDRRRRVGIGVRRGHVDGVAGDGRAADGDRRAGDRGVVERAGHGQAGGALAVRHVARLGHGRQRDVALRGEVGRQPHERRGRPGERRRRSRGMAVGEADRGDRRVGAVGRGRDRSRLPVLLGDEPDARGEVAHAQQQRRGAGRVTGRERLFGSLGRQHRPEVAGPLARGRPRPAIARVVAVAVAVVAMPAGAARLSPS